MTYVIIAIGDSDIGLPVEFVKNREASPTVQVAYKPASELRLFRRRNVITQFDMLTLTSFCDGR